MNEPLLLLEYEFERLGRSMVVLRVEVGVVHHQQHDGLDQRQDPAKSTRAKDNEDGDDARNH